MTRAAAYRRTVYRAGEVVVRIGRKNPGADRWMAARGARQAWFIGAWNPFSRPMPARWNEAAHQRLRRGLPGAVEGEGRLHRWGEAMLLTTAPAWRLRLLARRCRQAAVVQVPRGRSARLVWCLPGFGG